MNIQPVKTAIVGCGVISEAYLSTMTQKFKVLEVVGCCDLDEAKAKAKAQKYGIRALTMEEILADPALELVVEFNHPNCTLPGDQATSRRRQARLFGKGFNGGTGTCRGTGEDCQ